MARKKSPTSDQRSAADAAMKKILDASAERATGAVIPELAYIRLSEVTNSMRLEAGEEFQNLLKMKNAMDILTGLNPRDGYERMLVHQMMGAHNATMECYRRAMLPNQPPEGRDLNLKHAQKLSTLYAMQLDTLNKHRGKGQQKVTVEHVNVAAGGQAIVGNVEQRDAPSKGAKRRKVAPHRIAHQVAVPNPLDPPEKVRVLARSRVKVAHG